MPRHKHADAIIAWANGEEIEFTSPYVDGWKPLGPIPLWDDAVTYRIKPKRVKKEAEVVVYKTSDREIKAYVSFLGPTLQVYNATLIKVIHLEWEEEE